MSEFKEFQGKTLDIAIAEACAYYDSSREKLEIEIIEDAKSGIFGLVGSRKARINARRVDLPGMASRGKKQTRSDNGKADTPEKGKPEVATAQERMPESMMTTEVAVVEELPKPEKKAEAIAEVSGEPNGNVGVPFGAIEPSVEDSDDADDDNVGNMLDERPASRPERRPRERHERRENGRANSPQSEEASARQSQTRGSRRKQDSEQPDGKRRGQEHDARDADSQDLSTMPRVNLTELDQDKLFAVTRQMVLVLVKPILGEEEPTLEIKVGDDRVQVQIQSDSTGLLIGRDGQNLAAVQYLVARMISRAMEAQVRVQVDAGDYHSRQDVRLQELAVALADKVRATGKSQSTRPLSAYQRRVIHLALQEDPDVVTRSSGEGALKRVVVQRRKENSSNS